MNSLKKKLLFSILITLQLVVILVLYAKISEKQKHILGETSVNYVSRENIQRNNGSTIANYYEPICCDYNPGEQRFVKKPKAIYGFTNTDTLAEKTDYPVLRTKNTVRIITLGDSFTHGLNVSIEDNWTELLEKSLNGNQLCKPDKIYEVINLGVYGYDVEFAKERYRIRGQKYDPDLVVWLLKDDDIGESQDLILDIVKMAVGDPKFTEKKYFDARKKSIQSYGLDNILKRQKQSFFALRDYFDKDLLVVSLVQDKKIARTIDEWTAANKRNHLVKVQLDDDMIFPSDNHPNEKGHSRIADSVYHYLVNNFLNCE